MTSHRQRTMTIRDVIGEKQRCRLHTGTLLLRRESVMVASIGSKRRVVGGPAPADQLTALQQTDRMSWKRYSLVGRPVCD